MNFSYYFLGPDHRIGATSMLVTDVGDKWVVLLDVNDRFLMLVPGLHTFKNPHHIDSVNNILNLSPSFVTNITVDLYRTINVRQDD